MASSAKPTPKSSPKSATKKVAQVAVKTVKTAIPAAKSTAASASAKAEPSLRFYHSKALREKTHSVLSALESNPDHAKHGEAIADLVAELTEAGMDYYFMKPLKLAQVGFVGEQSARLGMSGAVKLISSVSRNYIVRMDKTQLLVVARYIRELA